MKKPFVFVATPESIALDNKHAAWKAFARTVREELCKKQEPAQVSPHDLCPTCGTVVRTSFRAVLEFECMACGWKTMQIRSRVFSEEYVEESEDGYRGAGTIDTTHDVVSYSNGTPVHVDGTKNAASRGFDLWNNWSLRYLPDTPPEIPDLPPEELIVWAEGLDGKGKRSLWAL